MLLKMNNVKIMFSRMIFWWTFLEKICCYSSHFYISSLMHVIRQAHKHYLSVFLILLILIDQLGTLLSILGINSIAL